MLGLRVSHLRLPRAAPFQSSRPLLRCTYGRKPQENTSQARGIIGSTLTLCRGEKEHNSLLTCSLLV